MIQAIWILISIGVLVLLGAAIQAKNNKHCKGIEIKIDDESNEMFIDENDIMGIINVPNSIVGSEVSKIAIRGLEEKIKKNAWIKNAELFFDNKQNLIVSIHQKQPIARIFANNGSSFYIDTAANFLPLSDKASAKVPVFTGFNGSQQKMISADSLLLTDIIKLSNFIMTDSFWMAQIAQIDITANKTFEVIPVIGNHTINIGTAADMENKFSRLFTFYKQAWLQNGINKYEHLDVQYNNQVVAVKKGVHQAIVDSVKAAQTVIDLMKANTHADSTKQVSTAEVNRMTNRRDTNKRNNVVLPKPVTNRH